MVIMSTDVNKMGKMLNSSIKTPVLKYYCGITGTVPYYHLATTQTNVYTAYRRVLFVRSLRYRNKVSLSHPRGRARIKESQHRIANSMYQSFDDYVRMRKTIRINQATTHEMISLVVVCSLLDGWMVGWIIQWGFECLETIQILQVLGMESLRFHSSPLDRS
jgi:hypothetical protein